MRQPGEAEAFEVNGTLVAFYQTARQQVVGLI